MKLTSSDMKKLGLTMVIKEPIGGAHANPAEAYENVKQAILQSLKELKEMDDKKRLPLELRSLPQWDILKRYNYVNNLFKKVVLFGTTFLFFKTLQGSGQLNYL